MKRICRDGFLNPIIPLNQIEYGVYGDPVFEIPKAIFNLLKGHYQLKASGLNVWDLGFVVRFAVLGSVFLEGYCYTCESVTCKFRAGPQLS